MKYKKLVALFLAGILILGSTIGVYADKTKNRPPQATAKVYFIDKDGVKQESALSVDYFKELSKNGKIAASKEKGLKDVITPQVVPLPESGATKITSSVFRSFTNKDVNTAIDIAIGTVFGYSWAKLSGSLIYAGIGTTILKNEWLNNFGAAAAGTAVSNALAFAHASPTYSESYQYKKWSSYYNCYIIYNVIVFYSDSSYKNPLEVNCYS